MKRNGILNPQLNRVISEMGHRDILNDLALKRIR